MKPPAKQVKPVKQHHSSTYAIANLTGLDPRMIKRFLRWRDTVHHYRDTAQPDYYWWKLDEREVEEAVELLKWAIAACPNKPVLWIKRNWGKTLYF